MMKHIFPPFLLIHIFTLLLINILYFIHFDELYLRTIITTYFLFFVPGHLFYKLIDKSEPFSARLICYSVGLSIALLMIEGLLLNKTLLYFTDIKPINTLPILITVNGGTILLFLITIIKRFLIPRNIHFSVHEEKFKIVDIVLLVIATLFPILSVIGTSLLNNGGNGHIILFNLYSIGIYILFVVLQKKLHSAVYTYSLYMIGLAVLLNLSLRSWLIAGSDIMLEYRMFQMSLHHQYWSNSLANHAYNICISITLLPAMLSKLLSIHDYYIYKFLYQLLFAFVPVIVYLSTKRFTNSIWSYLSGILFISFPIYVNSMPMHLRQEIAFIFFALMIYILFDTKLSFISKNLVLTIVGFSMIISHYSTTFIALTILSIWFLLDYVVLLLTFIRAKWKKQKKLIYTHRVPFYFLLFMFGCSFIWFSQITNLSTNLVNLKRKVVANIANVHSNDVRVDQTSLANQFNIFYKQQNKQELLIEYMNQPNLIKRKFLFYDPDSYKDYKPLVIEPQRLSLNIPITSFKYVQIYVEVIKKIQKVLTIIGVLYLGFLFITNKNSKDQRDYLVLAGTCLFLLLAFMIIPFFTIEYDILRTTQQLLVVLGYSTILGGLLFINSINNNLKKTIIGIFVVSYFFVYTDTINQLSGGVIPTVQLNNAGGGYERFTLYESEKQSILWLANNKKKEFLTQLDPDSVSKITAMTIADNNLNSSLVPSTVFRDSYVYLNKLNVKTGVSYRNFKGESLRYTLPLKFFDTTKNLLYSNGNSKVYK